MHTSTGSLYASTSALAPTANPSRLMRPMPKDHTIDENSTPTSSAAEASPPAAVPVPATTSAPAPVGCQKTMRDARAALESLTLASQLWRTALKDSSFSDKNTASRPASTHRQGDPATTAPLSALNGSPVRRRAERPSRKQARTRERSPVGRSSDFRSHPQQSFDASPHASTWLTQTQKLDPRSPPLSHNTDLTDVAKHGTLRSDLSSVAAQKDQDSRSLAIPSCHGYSVYDILDMSRCLRTNLMAARNRMMSTLSQSKSAEDMKIYEHLSRSTLSANDPVPPPKPSSSSSSSSVAAATAATQPATTSTATSVFSPPSHTSSIRKHHDKPRKSRHATKRKQKCMQDPAVALGGKLKTISIRQKRAYKTKRTTRKPPPSPQPQSPIQPPPLPIQETPADQQDMSHLHDAASVSLFGGETVNSPLRSLCDPSSSPLILASLSPDHEMQDADLFLPLSWSIPSDTPERREHWPDTPASLVYENPLANYGTQDDMLLSDMGTIASAWLDNGHGLLNEEHTLWQPQGVTDDPYSPLTMVTDEELADLLDYDQAMV